jgi:hypothetical protein
MRDTQQTQEHQEFRWLRSGEDEHAESRPGPRDYRDGHSDSRQRSLSLRSEKEDIDFFLRKSAQMKCTLEGSCFRFGHRI